MWVWNAANGWATFDLFRRGGKQPVDRIAGLPDRLERTLAVSFPKMFGLTDLGAGPDLALVLGAVLPALVLVMAVASRADIKQRRGRSPALVALVLFVVVVSLFAASKFSHRGAQRPRYLMPALHVGRGGVRMGHREPRRAGPGVGGGGRGGDRPGGEPRRARALAPGPRRGAKPATARSWRSWTGCSVRTGYAGFWVAPKYTFLSEGRVVLSGELGPIVSWVHPGHAARVRESGPDAYLVGTGELATAFEARLDELGVPLPADATSPGVAIFHDLCRPRLAGRGCWI